jgi:hypothetical protein
VAPNGDIAVSSDICLDGFGPNQSTRTAAHECQAGGALPPGDYATDGSFLIGYLIPTGSTAPRAMTSPDLSGVTFTSNSNYVAWLGANETTPAGFKWVAYMSSEFTVSEPLELHLTADFTVPAGSNDALYSGPYTVPAVVIGDRADGSFDGVTVDSGRPLDCDEAVPLPGFPDLEYPTGCANDMSKAIGVATRELGSTAPSSAISVQAGSTATVPFTIEYSGPSADPFRLSGSTSSNALVATPAAATFTPNGTGNTTEDVSVPVPAGLAPGTYTVTLNVGSFGSTAATLNVTAASTSATNTVAAARTPAVRPAISGLNVSSSSLKLTLRLNIAATERLTLQRLRGHRWITLKKLSTRGHAGLNTLRLKGLFGSRLTPAGRYHVRVQAIEGATRSRTQTLSFTVR